MAVTIDGTTGIDKVQDGSIVYADLDSNIPLGTKNLIINGDVRINQRGAGALESGFLVDRFNIGSSQASKGSATVQTSDVPVGFKSALKYTSSSAYSVLSTDYFFINQKIEGNNIAHLDWGTANAKTVTLSFWVKSSLTGTFGGAIRNSAYNYNYPFTYTISSANTWEQKSVTIGGPTSGTWLTTNGTGLDVWFSLGMGSSYSDTAGTWTTTAGLGSATGATSVVGTSGATWLITGIQLEAGDTATPFEYRSYGTELALCERYFQKIDGGFGVATASTNVQINVVMRVPMRTSPSATVTTFRITDMTTADHQATSATISLPNITPTMSRTNCGGFTGLTTSRPYTLLGSGTNAAPILFSAEL